jgi:hypothetical protein
MGWLADVQDLRECGWRMEGGRSESFSIERREVEGSLHFKLRQPGPDDSPADYPGKPDHAEER